MANFGSVAATVTDGGAAVELPHGGGRRSHWRHSLTRCHWRRHVKGRRRPPHTLPPHSPTTAIWPVAPPTVADSSEKSAATHQVQGAPVGAADADDGRTHAARVGGVP